MDVSEIRTLPDVLSALTALIAPTLLVSACGTFILSTAHRMSLSTERVRALVVRLARLSRKETTVLVARRRARLEREIELTFGRVLVQQRALGLFYGSAVTFVACSLTLGITAVLGVLAWVPAVLGFVGVALLLLACALLLVDAQRLVSDMKEEIAGARREHHAVLSHHEVTRSAPTSPGGSDNRCAGPQP